MPGMLVTTAASAICPHGASVSIVSSNLRVKAGGAPVATAADTFTVSGCPFQVPVGAGTKPQPCTTIQWMVPAVRVKAGGNYLILQNSTGLCLSAEQIPGGPPTFTVVQARVKAT